MDQRSFWIVDAAGAPRKLCRPPMTSPEPGRMLAFAPFQGFIRGMSGLHTSYSLAPYDQLDDNDIPPFVSVALSSQH